MTIALHSPPSTTSARPAAVSAEIAAPVEQDRTSRRRPAVLLIPIALIVLCATLLAAAYIQSMLVTGQQRLDELNHELVDERTRLQNERVSLAAETSPENVARRAEALGLVPAEERIVLTPGTDDSPDSASHSEDTTGSLDTPATETVPDPEPDGTVR